MGYKLAEPVPAPVNSYRSSLMLTDDVAEAVNFLVSAPHEKIGDKELCKNMP